MTARLPFRKRTIQKASRWTLALVSAFGLGAISTPPAMAAESEKPIGPIASDAGAEMLAQTSCGCAVTGVRG